MLNTLKTHAKKYPLMTPQDAVKLIYQNEFGGGHLIKDKEMSLKRIKEEYSNLPHSESEPLYEDIGNNIVRVNLKAMKAENLEKLNDAFVKSAEIHKGNMVNFLNKLSLLKENFSAIGFNFSENELKAYLDEYIKAGCPMVSHSRIYNEAYLPAYRIVDMKVFTENDLSL